MALDEVLREVLKTGTLRGAEVPEELRRIFVGDCLELPGESEAVARHIAGTDPDTHRLSVTERLRRLIQNRGCYIALIVEQIYCISIPHNYSIAENCDEPIAVPITRCKDTSPPYHAVQIKVNKRYVKRL